MVNKLVVLSGISRSAGGVYYAVKSLCKKLDNNCKQLFVYGRYDKNYPEDSLSWNPVSVTPYKSYGPIKYSHSLIERIHKASPSLVHLHGIWLYDQWVSLKLQNSTGCPVVISPHGMLDPWALNNSSFKKKFILKLFAEQSLKNATCIHALCKPEAEAIRKCGFKNPIAIIPNGIDLPINLPTNTKEKKVKTLLFLGRIHPKKGIKELILAWESFVKSSKGNIDWKLNIAGWGDASHVSDLKNSIDKKGLSYSVSYLGAVYGDDKSSLLLNSDAFILPSFSEGLPMSILEAWSFKLPVLMTSFCNIPEGFTENAAIYIEPNQSSIYDSLILLSNLSHDELHVIGVNGYNLVKDKFTWEKVSKQMIEVYDWCLDNTKSIPKCISFNSEFK